MTLSLMVFVFHAAAVLPTPCASYGGFCTTDGPEGNQAFVLQHWESSTHRFDPGVLLGRGVGLNLTEQQIERLTRLQVDAITAKQRARASYESQRAQLQEVLLATEPDLGKVRSHFDSAQASLSALSWTDISISLEARRVLTAEQQTIVVTSTVRRGARGPRSRTGRTRRR
jgi:Spy/CpxP family protein refolding chaperone